MNPMRYLMGARVYRGASNAPTRGTVDPMGYINRSLGMSPVGGDGLSDKRSGLASAALDRLRQGHGGRLGVPTQQHRLQQPQDDLRLPSHQINLPNPGGPTPGSFGGYSVSPTGQLLPNTPYPHQDTLQSLYGQQQQAQAEPQLMEAARNRLSHHIQTKEMLTKHQLQMQRMALQHAQHINQHRERAYGRA